MLNHELQKQINQNDNVQRRKMQKEKLTDAVNMGAVNQKLHAEKLEKMDHRKKQM